MGLFEILVIVFVLCPLAGAVAHRIKHGGSEAGGGPAVPPALEGTVSDIREELQRLQAQVDRLAEQQDFLERLLEERPALEPADEERGAAS